MCLTEELSTMVVVYGIVRKQFCQFPLSPIYHFLEYKTGE